MIERDYIMRMITQLTAVIRKLIGLKEAREYPQALDEIHRQCRSLVGVDPEFLGSFDVASLVHLFGSEPHTASTRCYAAGVLMSERAEILALLNRPDEASADRAQSLGLLLEAYQIADAPVDARHEELIEQLVDSLPLMPDASEGKTQRVPGTLRRKSESPGRPLNRRLDPCDRYSWGSPRAAHLLAQRRALVSSDRMPSIGRVAGWFWI